MRFVRYLSARFTVFEFVFIASLVSQSHAQNSCGEWSPGLFPLDGPASSFGARVHAFATFDDGSGPALYVGGDFQLAGATWANNIAKWNGTSWSPLGTGTSFSVDGFSGDVRCLAAFDDGTGPALYVGGQFDIAGGMTAIHVARWNGSTWSQVGSGLGPVGGSGEVAAFAVFDDGTGPALYAGGNFSSAGGTTVDQVVRWNGQRWSTVGSGIQGEVRALTAFDDGTGPGLYAGGDFQHSRTRALSHIARWNGSDWSPLGTGICELCGGGSVNALAVFDDGSGPALFAAGFFIGAGAASNARRIAKWNGSAWSELGGGLGDEAPYAMAVFDDGNGAALYVAGLFLSTGDGLPAFGIAKWNGTTWSSLGQGLSSGREEGRALLFFDNGTGPALYVGGDFFGAGDIIVNAVARWNGSTWSRLETGAPGRFFQFSVNAFKVFDFGTGPALFIGGDATSYIGPFVPKHPVVEWTGTTWTELPSMNDNVRALEVFDDGSGPALYVGGDFTVAGGIAANRVARWDGVNFLPLGLGVDAPVHSLGVFDDGSGPALYAGGEFTQAGGAPANRIARWNGASWAPLGDGIAGSFNPFHDSVNALRAFDDGSGPELFVGGQFYVSRGAPANGLAKWNGNAWSPVGGGTSGPVHALTVFDEGTGPALYAGGGFSAAGSTPANFVARWNGTTWTALGGGVNPNFEGILTLAPWDDGTGPALYAGGSFTDAEGIAAANNIARWNGSAWSALGSGMGGYFDRVRSLSPFDDGSGPSLYAGGSFLDAGGIVAGFLARWKVSSQGPRRGNVNAGAGTIRDVLFVNGSAGDTNRVVNVSAGAPLDVRLDHAPNGPLVAPYVLWAWAGAPSHAVELVRAEDRIGCLVNPTPLHRPMTPQPLFCLRTPQLPAIVCRGLNERSGPIAAPFTVHLSRGLRASAVLTLQGLVRDDLAANTLGFSVTNATTIHAQ